MNRPASEDSPSPAVHSQNIRRQLTELIEHVEADMGRVDDPRFRGLLEKSGEVLKSLRTLFERFTPTAAPTDGPAKQPAPQRGQTPKRRDDASSTKGKSGVAGTGRSQGGPARPANAATAASKGKAAGKNAGTAPASRANASRSAAAPAKGDKASRTDKGGSGSRDVSAQAAAPANVAKPQDPDELNARIANQRKEARAPILPAKGAPKPMPPQSGKPIWAKPHSS
jgi:hypothetical protein